MGEFERHETVVQFLRFLAHAIWEIPALEAGFSSLLLHRNWDRPIFEHTATNVWAFGAISPCRLSAWEDLICREPL
jgi:hypothetical protein